MLFLLYSQDEINSNILLSLIFLLYSQDEIKSNILLCYFCCIPKMKLIVIFYYL